MSWLYTIVFAGLVLSSDQTGSIKAEECLDNTPSAVHSVMDETEKFEKTFPLNANGKVNISNVNGSIVVDAWDRNEVKLEYTKIADSRERLSDVEIDIESRPDYFSVETDYNYSRTRNTGDRDTWKGGAKLTVEFRLMVPKGAVLNEVETVNGSVTVSNFVNYTAVSAVNGSVNASNIRGTAKLSTVNGEVKADFDRLESGCKISLETVNGRVNLLIPSDSNATLKAESLNGNISNEFGLPVRKGKYVGRDLHGRLGNGDVQIRLESVNGALTIGRKSDGKSLSPAVNLLDQKPKDDEDWDSEVSAVAKIDTVKMNQQIAKAVKDSARVTADVSKKVAVKAMAEAEKEMIRIQPELDKMASEIALGSVDVLRAQAASTGMAKAQMAQLDAMARMSDAAFFPGLPRVERKSNSFPVKGTPKVTIIGKGCSVVVKGWDKPEVQYRVTQFADQRNRRPFQVNEEKSENAVTITVVNPEGDRSLFEDSRRVTIEVFVPRTTNLKIDANGTIRLDGVSGELQLKGNDQSIDVRDSDGKLNVTTSDGQIRIIGFRGDLVAQSNDGDVRMDGDFTSITGQTNDGTFFLTVPADIDADIAGTGKNGFSFEVDDISNGKMVDERNWKFGKGTRKYRFNSQDGTLVVQNRDLLNSDSR